MLYTKPAFKSYAAYREAYYHIYSKHKADSCKTLFDIVIAPFYLKDKKQGLTILSKNIFLMVFQK